MPSCHLCKILKDRAHLGCITHSMIKAVQTIAWLQIVLLTLISWQERPLCQQTECCWICAVVQVEQACQSWKDVVTLSKLQMMQTQMHANVQQAASRARKAKLCT